MDCYETFVMVMDLLGICFTALLLVLLRKNDPFDEARAAKNRAAPPPTTNRPSYAEATERRTSDQDD